MTTGARPFTLADLPNEIREAIYDHVFAHDDIEVGGVIVGAIDDAGVAEVHGMIAALEADGARASVTFTHEAWDKIIEVQERDFPSSPTIVGWYHSHPGFGIFLSEHDVFIQQNFFRQPYQLAYVVDPQEEQEGVFGWRDGDIALLDEGQTPRRRGRRRPTVVVDLDADDAAGTPNGPRPEPHSVPRSAASRRLVELEAERRRKRRWRRGLAPVLAGSALLAAGAIVLGLLEGSKELAPSGTDLPERTVRPRPDDARTRAEIRLNDEAVRRGVAKSNADQAKHEEARKPKKDGRSAPPAPAGRPAPDRDPAQDGGPAPNGGPGQNRGPGPPSNGSGKSNDACQGLGDSVCSK